MLEKLYKAIWTRIGGRPWTEISRDEQKKSPLVFMLIFFGIGVLMVKFGKGHWWQLILSLLAGIIIGHIWW